MFKRVQQKLTKIFENVTVLEDKKKVKTLKPTKFVPLTKNKTPGRKAPRPNVFTRGLENP